MKNPYVIGRKSRSLGDQTEMADGYFRNRIHYVWTGITDRYQVSLDVRDGCHQNCFLFKVFHLKGWQLPFLRFYLSLTFHTGKQCITSTPPLLRYHQPSPLAPLHPLCLGLRSHWVHLAWSVDADGCWSDRVQVISVAVCLFMGTVAVSFHSLPPPLCL